MHCGLALLAHHASGATGDATTGRATVPLDSGGPAMLQNGTYRCRAR